MWRRLCSWRSEKYSLNKDLDTDTDQDEAAQYAWPARQVLAGLLSCPDADQAQRQGDGGDDEPAQQGLAEAVSR